MLFKYLETMFAYKGLGGIKEVWKLGGIEVIRD